MRQRTTTRWFHRAVQGAKLVQRVIRARLYWKNQEMVKKTLKRPVRIKLHDFDIFVKSATETSSGINDIEAELPQENFRIGDMPAAQYDDLFRSNKNSASTNGTTQFDSTGTTGAGNASAENKEMISLLKLDHEHAPSYTEPANLSKRPKGTLFLTISLHQILEHGFNGKQEYRIDIPLEQEDQPSKIYVRKGRAGSPQIQKFGAHQSMDPDLFSQIEKEYKMTKYFPANNRSYVLVPACTAEINIRMTISEVQDWPKAIVRGQSELNLFYYMIWKRCSSHLQDFSNEIRWENLPSSSDGSVLSLQMPPQAAQSNKYLDRSSRLTMPSNRSQEAKKVGKSASENGYKIKGGFLTWTILPFSDSSDNHYGQLHSLNTGSIDSARRRIWIIIVDKILHIYNPNAVQPRLVFNMNLVSVSAVQGQIGLIKLKTPTETFFLVDDDDKSGKVWFKKLYIQRYVLFYYLPTRLVIYLLSLSVCLSICWSSVRAQLGIHAKRNMTPLGLGASSLRFYSILSVSQSLV